MVCGPHMHDEPVLVAGKAVQIPASEFHATARKKLKQPNNQVYPGVVHRTICLSASCLVHNSGSDCHERTYPIARGQSSVWPHLGAQYWLRTDLGDISLNRMQHWSQPELSQLSAAKLITSVTRRKCCTAFTQQQAPRPQYLMASTYAK